MSGQHRAPAKNTNARLSAPSHRKQEMATTAALLVLLVLPTLSCSGSDSDDIGPESGLWGSSTPSLTEGNQGASMGGPTNNGNSDSGGNNNGAPSDTPSDNGGEIESPTPTPEPTPADTNYCADTEGWDPEWVQLENDILELVNQRRAEGAVCGGQSMPSQPPLTADPALTCAARRHSMDMAERSYFSHNNPDGEGPRERMAQAGFDGNGWAENIAAGSRDAAGTMDQWMNSSGHCSNIMSDHALIGIGYYPGGEYGTLWTQVFGR